MQMEHKNRWRNCIYNDIIGVFNKKNLDLGRGNKDGNCHIQSRYATAGG